MAIRVLSSKTPAEIAARHLARQARLRRTPTTPAAIQPMYIVKTEKPK